MTYGHRQADCLDTGINFGPNARYRVWEAFTFTILLGKPVSDCMFAVIKMELSGKTVYGPVLKTTQLSARAQIHASPERCRKSVAMIFLGDHDIP